MGWFSDEINQRATVSEGNYNYWRITLNRDTWVNLSVYRIDGYGPTLYVIPSDEFYNYTKGRIFKHMVDFHFENIDEFSNRAILPRGSYHIVVSLPQIPDDRNSISEFNIRYEVVQ